MEKITKPIIIKSDYSRRYPDPLNQCVDEDDAYNIEHHILLCKAIDVPEGISKGPNPREQKIDYGIYKKIQGSLEDVDDLTFHLKNKGITVLANKVEYSDDKRTANILLGEKGGIADGGHTYEILLDSKRKGTCPEGQYVKFEVLTGVPHEMFVDITGGLNTAVQVQEASLANLEGKFEWIKEELKGMPYADSIAYKQNENKPVDIRDLFGLITLFNLDHFDAQKHPKEAYTSKAACLTLYGEDPDSFKKLKPILKDILALHDYVHIASRKRYNQEKGGKAGAMKGVYERRKRGEFEFPFTGAEDECRLYSGTLFPIMGALRFLVKKNKEGAFVWKLGSLDKVKEFFHEIAPSLIETTYKTTVNYGNKPNAVGKDDNHWDNLFKTVALHYLTKDPIIGGGR